MHSPLSHCHESNESQPVSWPSEPNIKMISNQIIAYYENDWSGFGNIGTRPKSLKMFDIELQLNKANEVKSLNLLHENSYKRIKNLLNPNFKTTVFHKNHKMFFFSSSYYYYDLINKKKIILCSFLDPWRWDLVFVFFDGTKNRFISMLKWMFKKKYTAIEYVSAVLLLRLCVTIPKRVYVHLWVSSVFNL